jgi:hypothetical protein
MDLYHIKIAYLSALIIFIFVAYFGRYSKILNYLVVLKYST